MANTRFITALIVLFITIIGIPIGLLGFRCGADLPQDKKFREFVCNENEFVSQGPGKPNKMRCALDENVWPRNCDLPFWDNFTISYNHTKSGVRKAATGIIVGTFVLDGLVVGAYKMFGKERRPQKETENEQN